MSEDVVILSACRTPIGSFGGFAVAHVHQWLLIAETSPQRGELTFGLLSRYRDACPMARDEPKPGSDNRRNRRGATHTN